MINIESQKNRKFFSRCVARTGKKFFDNFWRWMNVSGIDQQDAFSTHTTFPRRASKSFGFSWEFQFSWKYGIFKPLTRCWYEFKFGMNI